MIQRTVMRYHGGKFGGGGYLADWIISHLPPHRIYVEPFGGAASVLMRKPRAYAEIYNDLAGEVVNVFRVLRDQPDKLERLLRLTPFARQEFDLSYVPVDDRVEQARRTVFRSLAGFGSAAATKDYRTGFRANSNRSGSTPAHEWAAYPNHVQQFADRLQGVVVECRDACEVMRQHDGPDTLHFVDPPYVWASRGQENPYDGAYEHDMTDEQHRELADCLRSLDGAVVLCGYPSALYDELYGDWHQVSRRAMADGARARTEVLWLNMRAASGVGQGDLFRSLSQSDATSLAAG